jgi:tryptophanyl-tRNA synthetase
MSARVRAFSGVQPTGSLHLGNYLGALRPWVRHQADRENIFCVVNLHALTIPEAIDPRELRENSRRIAAMFLAAGIDPEQSSVFLQSAVREHSELAWVLNCVTPLGWLERMTQFKSKADGRDTVGTGLLDYPVLMAADILLYDTQVVPVGDDQKQHIELARDIALRFNRMFGETLVVPAISLPPVGARVMGLDEPTVKMSKSIGVARPGHAIGLLDPPKTIQKKINRAVTDAGCDYDPETCSPGVLNLMHILSACTGESLDDVARRFAGQGYGFLKKEVGEAVVAELEPVQQRYEWLSAEPGFLDGILDRSAAHARSIAQGVMARVRHATGLV